MAEARMRILESLPWTEIATALKAQACGSPGSSPRGASIDTRTLERGDVFFALKGERADGHDHVQAALETGAACVVVRDRNRVPTGAFALVVEDPERSLFELASLIRSRSQAVFVAITGSTGKTTAKEFTALLLAARGPVLATRGNLNNHLGVPLTLARLESEHWAAVIECGMSHPGEISRLVHLIRPKIAAVTNVAEAHLEFFASVDDIASAKCEVFETLEPGDFAVAPANEPRLTKRVLGTPATPRFFGDGPEAAIRAEAVTMSLDGSRFDLQGTGERVAVFLPVPGPHAVSNFLLAAAIANALGVSAEAIALRARRLTPGGNRGAVTRLQDDILLIDDTYNSNPKALRAAIETLGLARGRRRVACIGDMLELGKSGPQLHREAGAAIGTRVDLLLGVGALAVDLIEGASALPPQAKQVFADSVELASRITTLVQSHDAVLVKGSRGTHMERVVDALLAAYPEIPA
jgi:UDP-N-acetylmuramoyl-tripeptide--D-alanyl-D-alanine ligase